MDQAEVVLDYVEALAWPVVLAALAGTVLAAYRRQIGDLIDRMRRLRVGPGSAEFGAGPQAPPEGREAVEDAPEKIAELVREQAAELERGYMNRLADLSERFAATEFYWFCERVYRTIYGTQIRLLQHLQDRAAVGGSVGELVPFFQEHVAAVRVVNPAYQTSFDVYVGYLVASELATPVPGDATRYRIAPRGVGFLAYLPWAGIAAWKPY